MQPTIWQLLVAAVIFLLLLIPNLIWTRNQPKGYTSENEHKILGILERVGEVLTCCAVLVFSDFNLKPWSVWSLWLAVSFRLMVLYELYWIRYFRSVRRLEDFYASFLGIPVAGATLPVAAFLLLSVYGKNIILAGAVVILGIGHIGIHLMHQRP